MRDSTVPILPILTGPTGSGKTELAIAFAERHGLEIISADSRQVYQGLEVATAAPDTDQLARVPHHLISNVPLSEDYHAGRFCRDVKALLGTEESGSPRFMMCGGSGFYLHAFLNPVDPSLAPSSAHREEVRTMGDSLTPEAFKAELLARDPEAAWIPVGDRSKIGRYLEICLATGDPASLAMRERLLPRPVRPVYFAMHPLLTWLTPFLRKRAWWMLRHGMVDEIAAALEQGITPDSNALKSVGVREVSELIARKIDLPFCHNRLTSSTRRYAKKQLTWIRGQAIKETMLFLDPGHEQEVLLDRMSKAFQEELDR
jgi:tRNA dimethylallyltransferase